MGKNKILVQKTWNQIFLSKNNQVRERSSITSARLGGVGGLSQNADTADALEGGGGV